MTLPTPHLDKINAAIANDKMPAGAVEELNNLLLKYQQWISDMEVVNGYREDVLRELVSLFNGYKFYVDFNLIFSSQEDFLYRQKGQLKLDNTVIEEFLPHLVSKAFPELTEVSLGPTKCFSAAYFKTSLNIPTNGGGLSILADKKN